VNRRSPPTVETPAPQERASLRRTLAGIIGLVLLSIAASLAITPAGDQAQLWMSSCLRVGAVLCLLWLAWPQLSRLHPWVILGGIAGLLAVLVLLKGQFRVLLIAVVVLIVLARARSSDRRGRR
jgi:hypothetical protein